MMTVTAVKTFVSKALPPSFFIVERTLLFFLIHLTKINAMRGIEIISVEEKIEKLSKSSVVDR